MGEVARRKLRRLVVTLPSIHEAMPAVILVIRE
jgi:hypothetical protein